MVTSLVHWKNFTEKRTYFQQIDEKSSGGYIFLGEVQMSRSCCGIHSLQYSQGVKNTLSKADSRKRLV